MAMLAATDAGECTHARGRQGLPACVRAYMHVCVFVCVFGGGALCVFACMRFGASHLCVCFKKTQILNPRPKPLARPLYVNPKP